MNEPQRFAILVMSHYLSFPPGHHLPAGSVGEIKRVGSHKTLIDFKEKAATGRWLFPYLFREIDAVERLALVHEA